MKMLHVFQKSLSSDEGLGKDEVPEKDIVKNACDGNYYNLLIYCVPVLSSRFTHTNYFT